MSTCQAQGRKSEVSFFSPTHASVRRSLFSISPRPLIRILGLCEQNVENMNNASMLRFPQQAPRSLKTKPRSNLYQWAQSYGKRYLRTPASPFWHLNSQPISTGPFPLAWRMQRCPWANMKGYTRSAHHCIPQLGNA